MSIIIGIIIGVIALTILVATHELGHALMAKKFGTKVEEFGIGFPPKMWAIRPKKSFLGKNVQFSINWLPLGGFVKLQGEHDDDTAEGDYGHMTYGQKSLVLLAGVLVNWLTAVVVITILAWIGLPKLLPDQFVVVSDNQNIVSDVQILGVEKGLPGATAGLQAGDKVKTFDGETISSAEQLTDMALDNKGKTVDISYERGDKLFTTSLKLRSNNDDQKGIIGASLGQREFTRATWSAPIVGVGVTAQMSYLTLKGVVEVLWNGLSGLVMKVIPSESVQTHANAKLATVSESVAGPLSIFGVLFPAAEKAGFSYVLAMAAIISLTLAIMNVLPIPALDGGRWFVMTLYKLRNKKLTKETEEKIHGVGFAVLMVLIVLVTISDIGRISGQ